METQVKTQTCNFQGNISQFQFASTQVFCECSAVQKLFVVLKPCLIKAKAGTKKKLKS